MPSNNTGGTTSGTPITGSSTVATNTSRWTVTADQRPRQQTQQSGRSASDMMEEVLRIARENARRNFADPELRGLIQDDDNLFDDEATPSMPMPLDCELLKKRHLNKSERQAYHKPKRDWELTNKGEVCKSACSLVVDDLVE